MNLHQELEAYKKALPTLVSEEGKFALVIGDSLVGVYESYADALSAGYDRAGLTPFLVKRIAANEMVAYFSRDLESPCRT